MVSPWLSCMYQCTHIYLLCDTVLNVFLVQACSLWRHSHPAFFSRHIHHNWHQPASPGGHQHRGHTSHGAPHPQSARLQHPDAWPVRLLSPGRHWACRAQRSGQGDRTPGVGWQWKWEWLRRHCCRDACRLLWRISSPVTWVKLQEWLKSDHPHQDADGRATIFWWAWERLGHHHRHCDACCEWWLDGRPIPTPTLDVSEC